MSATARLQPHAHNSTTKQRLAVFRGLGAMPRASARCGARACKPGHGPGATRRSGDQKWMMECRRRCMRSPWPVAAGQSHECCCRYLQDQDSPPRGRAVLRYVARISASASGEAIGLHKPSHLPGKPENNFLARILHPLQTESRMRWRLSGLRGSMTIRRSSS